MWRRWQSLRDPADDLLHDGLGHLREVLVKGVVAPLVDLGRPGAEGGAEQAWWHQKKKQVLRLIAGQSKISLSSSGGNQRILGLVIIQMKNIPLETHKLSKVTFTSESAVLCTVEINELLCF